MAFQIPVASERWVQRTGRGHFLVPYVTTALHTTRTSNSILSKSFRVEKEIERFNSMVNRGNISHERGFETLFLKLPASVMTSMLLGL